MEAQNKVAADITELNSTSQVAQHCGKGKRQCLIGLFDGSSAAVEEQVALLKAQGYYVRGQPIDLYWMDAACHYELLLQLEIGAGQLPTVISYNPAAKRYERFVMF
jgi:hypothetical protein